jgi:hypothetical protein
MKIVIEDISMADALDREALTAVSGGVASIPDPSPWGDYLPQFPGFPSGFPFTGFNPEVHRTPEIVLSDPQDPLAQ